MYVQEDPLILKQLLLQIHQNNTEKITSYSTQIDAAYTTTTQQYSEIQQAQGNATQLLNEVTEAERKWSFRI